MALRSSSLGTGTRSEPGGCGTDRSKGPRPQGPRPMQTRFQHFAVTSMMGAGSSPAGGRRPQVRPRMGTHRIRDCARALARGAFGMGGFSPAPDRDDRRLGGAPDRSIHPGTTTTNGSRRSNRWSSPPGLPARKRLPPAPMRRPHTCAASRGFRMEPLVPIERGFVCLCNEPRRRRRLHLSCHALRMIQPAGSMP